MGGGPVELKKAVAVSEEKIQPNGAASFPAAVFLAGKCPNLGRDSISCCRKIGEEFSSSVEICRKTFPARNFGQPQSSRVLICSEECQKPQPPLLLKKVSQCRGAFSSLESLENGPCCPLFQGALYLVPKASKKTAKPEELFKVATFRRSYTATPA